MAVRSSSEVHFGPIPPILDLHSHQVSTLLPGSQGIYSPRWSPDGRYIAALPNDSLRLLLFDIQTQHWSELGAGNFSFPSWSADGKSIYFLQAPGKMEVRRIRLSDRRLEVVADLKNLTITGYYGIWLGLAPDDSPLLLRDAGTQDIYALDWGSR